MKKKFIIPIIIALFVVMSAGTYALAENNGNGRGNGNSGNSGNSGKSKSELFSKNNKKDDDNDSMSKRNYSTYNKFEKSTNKSENSKKEEVKKDKDSENKNSQDQDDDSQNEDSKNEDRKPKTSSPIFCPPGHYHAKGWIKNILRRGLDNPCIPDVVDTLKISNISVSNITTNSVVIKWDTNISASSSVAYGTTNSYGSTATNSSNSWWNKFWKKEDIRHSVKITGLSNDTLYHFKITSVDNSNNSASSADMTFKTLLNNDTTAPVISNISVSAISSNSATVTWNTDESSTSRVKYGTTNSYGASVYNAGLVTSHSVVIPSLTASTTYHFQVVSVDSYDNSSSSLDATFTTLVTPDITAPVISAISTRPIFL